MTDEDERLTREQAARIDLMISYVRAKFTKPHEAVVALVAAAHSICEDAQEAGRTDFPSFDDFVDLIKKSFIGGKPKQ